MAVADKYAVVEGVEIAKLQPLPKHVLIRWLKKEETKGGILLPQTRQRSGFMKGIVLAIGPKCDPALEVGQTVEFNGLGDKEWLGVQDPADRDTVFFTRVENVYGIINRGPGDKPVLDMVGTWLLVRPDEMPKEKSGLVMVQQAREREMRQRAGLIGTVVSAGGHTAQKAGDRIAFDATGATRIHLGDHNDEVVLVIDGDLDDGAVLGEVEDNGDR